jgi:hypothetical protein
LLDCLAIASPYLNTGDEARIVELVSVLLAPAAPPAAILVFGDVLNWLVSALNWLELDDVPV